MNMPNLMIDSLKSFVSATGATESLGEIKDGAEVIKDAFMSGARTAQETYRNMRAHGFRKITDWFKDKGDEYAQNSTLDDTTDDFDAGFQYGDDESSSTEDSTLDYDSMKGLMKGQVSAMYQIGGKQAEATALSSSEIISNFNSRSSEILSSLGTLNSSLTQISTKLDRLIEIQTPKAKEGTQWSSVFDAQGNLSLGSVFKYITQDSTAASYIGMGKDMLDLVKMIATSGMPAGYMIGQGAHMLVGNKEFKSLNGMSINDIGEEINDRVRNATNTALRAFTNTSFFKKIFGKIDNTGSNQDYTSYIENQYTKDPAVFDGMTRKTIIDIIPGYLKKITEAVTGQRWNISDYGTLTMQEQTSRFAENAYESLFSGSLSSKDIRRLSKNTTYNQDDINKAQRALLSYYTWHFFNNTTDQLNDAFFKNRGNDAINNAVAENLAKTQNGSISYWGDIVQLIVGKLASDRTLRGNFIRQITATTQNTDLRNTQFAESADNISDIVELTEEGFKRYVTAQMQYMRGDNRTYQERIDAKEMTIDDKPKGAKLTDRPSDLAIQQAKLEKLKQSEIITDSRMSMREAAATQTDYLLSIFEILNRGINVYQAKRNKPFGKFHLLHATSTAPTHTTFTDTELEASQVAVDRDISEQSGEESEEQKQPLTPGEELTNNMLNLMNPSNMMNTIRGAVSTEFNNFKVDAANATAFVIDNQLDNYNYKKFIEEQKSEIANIKESMTGDNSISADDKAIADEVLAAMQASVADGQTENDKSALSQHASQIKNQKLRSRITTLVESTFSRTAEKKPAQSRIGRILLWGFGLVKKFVSPLLSAAKSFLLLVGKKIAKPIVESLKSSWQLIKNGARNVKEGAIGAAKESVAWMRDRGIPAIKDKAAEMIVAASDAWNSEKGQKIRGKIRDAGYIVQSAAQLAGKKIKDVAGGVKERLISTGENVKQNIAGSTLVNAAQELGREASSKIKGTAINIGSHALYGWNQLKDSNFGKGFAEAFKKAEETKKMKPETVADQSTMEIAKAIQSPDGKIDNKETFFSRVLTIFASWNEKFEKALNGEQTDENNTQTMPDLTSSNGVNLQPKGGTSTMPSVEDGASAGTATTATAMPEGATPVEGAAAEGAGGISGMVGKIKGAFSGGVGSAGGMGFNLGKMLGGMTSILLGIGKAVLTVITSMEGFKALMNIGTDILKKSLKPLNKVFTRIYRILKPIVRTITKLLKQIVQAVVDIVQSIIDVIQPILQAIEPIISSLLDAVMPILELLTGLVNVIMIPLAGVLKVVVVPILQTISNTLDIIGGLLKIGFGGVMWGVGGVITLMGGILKFLVNSKVQDVGKNLSERGSALMKEGWDQVGRGVKGQLSLAGDTLSSLFGKEKTESTTTSRSMAIDTTLRGSAFDATYGSGDESLMDAYGGSGAQGAYGNYMNMTKRGCGPVALADAYTRRTGARLNPMQLTSVMASTGMYNKNAGTSVGNYIKSSKALGMNLTPGGVNSRSLATATPSNPITILGSGPDYTTRRGNNHYMNVIHADGNVAYVTNPMTGRVERKSTQGLINNAVLGLYGSGDAADLGYDIGDDAREKIETLKQIVSSIVDIFKGDSSIEAALDRETEKQRYEQSKFDTADMSDEEKESIDKRAKELFEKEHGRMKDESDKDFDKRYERYKKKYWAIAAAEAVRDRAQAKYDGTDNGIMAIMRDTLGDEENEGILTSASKSLSDTFDSIESGGLSKLLQSNNTNANMTAAKGPHFASDTGAVLWTDQYHPRVMQNDARKWSRTAPNDMYDLILAEFFQNTISPQIKLTGAFKKYLNPVDADAVGTQGEAHTGADFTIGGNPEIHATTGGTVTAAETNNDHFGSYIEITDVGGARHIYAHLKDAPKFKVGDMIEGGDVIGNIGGAESSKVILNRGNDSLVQSGEHLHYEIRDRNNTIINPFTYFKYRSGGSNSTSLSGSDAMIRAAAEVFTRAYETKGSPLKHNAGSVHNITFDDGLTIDQMDEHCTGSMAAVVKRMGYYTHPDGRAYSDTHQGESYMGGSVGSKWGLSNTVGTAKIYNRDGSVSMDWETGPGTQWQPGDIMFTGLGDAHAHMPVFKSTDGQWLGFNGGQDASFANSVALGYYYLQNGTTPTDVVNKQTEGNHYDQQIGALAGPLSYYLRYVGGPMNFNTSTDDYELPAYDDGMYGDVSDIGVAQTEYVNSMQTQDSVSGEPFKYGTDGVVYNRALVALANWSRCSGIMNADEAFTKNHPDAIKKRVMLGYGSGTQMTDVFIYNFRKTKAGENCKVYLSNLKDYSIPKRTKTSNQNDASSVVVGVSGSDISSYLTKVYKGGLYKQPNKKQRQYFSNWSSKSIAQRLAAINGLYSPSGMQYGFTQSQIENAIKNKINVWELEPGMVNDGTNVINPSNIRSSTTTTTTTVPIVSRSNQSSSSVWGNILGSGDTPIDFGDMYQDASVAPIIINQMGEPVDTSSDIQALLTNTYNVKSEKIEGILEDMLKLMKEKNQRRRDRQLTTTPKTQNTQTQFSNTDIPRQVERLSIG